MEYNERIMESAKDTLRKDNSICTSEMMNIAYLCEAKEKGYKLPDHAIKSMKRTNKLLNDLTDILWATKAGIILSAKEINKIKADIKRELSQ